MTFALIMMEYGYLIPELKSEEILYLKTKTME